MSIQHVAVFCASTPRGPKAPSYLAMARRLGELLAEQGFHCVNGGANGMMKELCEGVKSAGGVVHCVNLEAHPPDHAAYDHLESHTLLSDRQMALINKADAFVLLPGGYGSLYEIAEVLARMALYEIDPAKPVIIVGPEWRHLELLFKDMGDNGLLTNPLPPSTQFVKSIHRAMYVLMDARDGRSPAA